MKKTLLTVTATIFSILLHAQTVCNPNGNLVIYSNYDGGMLNINVDVNIPNLKIGIVSYEADSINLSGSFVNNVTGVVWAGYNGTNHHCALPVITNTTINGAPGSATTNINILPLSPISNPNGYYVIVCNYSCDVNSNQGGCNTSDQIEAYFLQQFPGSAIYSDFTQYGCWTTTKNISNGGNCCATINPLTSSANSNPETCAGICNGTASVTASGGQTPYTYSWNNGATTNAISNLCAGNYTVVVSDAGANTTTQSVTVSGASPISFSQTASGCEGFFIKVGVNTYITTGIYNDTLLAANGCDSIVTTNLTILSPVINSQPVDQSIANGGTATFITSSTVTATFQWQEDAGSGFVNIINTTPYSGATDDTLKISPCIATMSGNIYRCIISESSCSDTTNVALLSVIISGVNEVNSNEISVYPNPTNGNLFIKGFLPTKIIVMNKIGQIVFIDTNKSVVSMANYPQGIYFIRLYDENNLPVLTEKIEVQ